MLNLENKKEYDKKWRLNNIERMRELRRNWEKKNKNKRKQLRKNWKIQNKDYYKDRYQNYKEYWREYNRNYYANLTSYQMALHCLRSANRRARNMKAKGSFTLQEWEALKKKHNYTCLICWKKEPEIKLTIDHVIPLSKNGTNWIENIQPLCKSCNCSKGTNTKPRLLVAQILQKI